MKKQVGGTRPMNRTHELPISEADARVFVTVADAGSFTAAAALHAMTPLAVSKAIGRLESDLGVRLPVRTTRALHLTEEGAAFHERCARAFEMLAEAAEEAGAGTHAVAGTVRRRSSALTCSHRDCPHCLRGIRSCASRSCRRCSCPACSTAASTSR